MNFTILGFYCVVLKCFIFEANSHPYSCYATDCHDVQEIGFTTSGVYRIFPGGMYKGFDVYCDFTTDSDGWLVFQRRIDGSVDFDKTWDEYVVGFGDLSGEHWLGNRALKSILSQGSYELQMEIVYRNLPRVIAKYGIFNIGEYADNYKISIGVATGFRQADVMLYHDGAEFSTRDKENNPRNCSTIHTGGWWFKDCRSVNLNGTYGNNKTIGITWSNYNGEDFPMKKTEMKIRRL